VSDQPSVHCWQTFQETNFKESRGKDKRYLLGASQFGFHARHSNTLQCMRLMDHVTLNFNMTRAVYSWISRKALTQHGTLAHYASSQN
jgi:hypothetical protein